MNVLYTNRPLFKSPDGWLRGTLQPLGGYPAGYFTLVSAAGRVVSVQPNGVVDSRDPGTAGPYEICRLIGDKLIFTPGVDYVFSVVVTS